MGRMKYIFACSKRQEKESVFEKSSSSSNSDLLQEQEETLESLKKNLRVH